MIAAITRGSNAAGLARYLHGPGKANQHRYAGRPGGAVIAGTAGPPRFGDGKLWAKDFHRTIAAAGNDRVRRPIWHCSLRTSREDRVMSDAEWCSIAEEFAEAMGIEELPWVAVRHGDDHVHLAVCRVGDDGRVWAGQHDRRLAQVACAQIEQDHGLTAAPRQRSRARRGPDSQVRLGEHAQAQRTGQTPQRVVLAEKVIAVLQVAAGRGRAGFEAECARVGITATANVASRTGRVSGYTFTDTAVPAPDRLVFKASQLHKCLSWAQLAPVLDQADQHTRQPGGVDRTAVYAGTQKRLTGYTRTWQIKQQTRRTRPGGQTSVKPSRAARPDRPGLGLDADIKQAVALARTVLAPTAAAGPTQPAAVVPAAGRPEGGHDRDQGRPAHQR